jgi:hypothetical protein
MNTLNLIRIVVVILVVMAYSFGFYSGQGASNKIDAVTSDGQTTTLTVSTDSLTKVPCGTAYITKP